MCRFVAYTGAPILLEDVIVKPVDSLINQSLQARESTVLTNGDGFGLGWYVPEISPSPAVFLSIFPAWNDENLMHLAAKIKASLFFSHVRAASTGGVNQYNCHPFIYKRSMFMHNGQINNFSAIKRHLRRLLDDEIYHWIRGETDSEHFFALFLQLIKNRANKNLESIIEALLETFQIINQLLRNSGVESCCLYNLCLTDGERIIATRYSTDPGVEPETLYYLEGHYFWCPEADSAQKNKKKHHGVLIASEKLTDLDAQWQLIPANHMLIVEKNLSTQLISIK